MSTGKLYLTALALSLLLAACFDDPLAVTESDLPLVDEYIAMAVAHTAQDDGAVIEPFRPRLAVHLSVDGALVPLGTVTLRIKGVANEKLTGGQVRVMLPTMAAVEHAGADKRPSYPVGQQFPAIASWMLPAMGAGGMWQQTVQITLPEKGYYQVAVRVTVTAPEDEESPVVFDDTSNEAWLLVMDRGGRVTDFFDESVVPEGFAPGEGPFREIPTASGAQYSADVDTGADGDNDISIHLVYYHNGARHNAAKAEITFKYKAAGTHNLVRTSVRTVPASGIVTVSCPASNQYIQAFAIVPTTSEVYADDNIATFYAGRNDCGETTQVSSKHTLYMPWSNLNKAIPKIEDHFDQFRGLMTWEFNSSNKTARYYSSSDHIVFGRDDYYKLWVAAHEFGHGFHHIALGGMWSTDCRGHDIPEPSNYKCAFSEGFADYAGNIGQGNPEWWEYKHYTKSGHDEAEIEGNIAALLHDLIDSNADSSDRTNYPADYIADVFETCRASGSKRNNVTDFVWCLENRINGAVHNSGFPRGPDAPSKVRESATEPDDWDEDDIRAVWWKNVT
ncbi:MAG: hypothetical protein OXE73_12765 [Gammaproteobacteria bacterium]|nr:hypothetical protein [Gammaproteobacteria bacterium]